MLHRVPKFQEPFVIGILREINFRECRNSKTFIFTLINLDQLVQCLDGDDHCYALSSHLQIKQFCNIEV